MSGKVDLSWRRTAAAAVAVTTGLVLFCVVSAASSADVGRVQVGVPGINTTEAFAPSLYVQATSPAEYARGCCLDSDSGEWLGPQYVASDSPGIKGPSSITWAVDFQKGGANPQTVATRALIHGFQTTISSAAVSVQHVVGTQAVGALSGYAILKRAAAPSTIDAEHEGALAFSLGSNVYAVATFSLLAPYADDTGLGGHFFVSSSSGSILASTWNGQQGTTSLSNVVLDGNLPPATVTAAATSNHRKVKGTVKDSFGEPLITQSVRLQKRTSRGWRTVRSGNTDTSGKYSIRATSSGSYRAYVQLGGTRKTSSTVTAGT